MDEEYGTIVYAQRREKAEGKNQFRGIIRKDLRPHLIMSIALPFFQQVNPYLLRTPIALVCCITLPRPIRTNQLVLALQRLKVAIHAPLLSKKYS